MDTKLTLKLNQEVIEKAKKFASSQNRSLSRMVEAYLRALVDSEKETVTESKVQITPYVKSLGLKLPIPADLDERTAYRDYLEEKHR
jgi:hypothetical protein